GDLLPGLAAALKGMLRAEYAQRRILQLSDGLAFGEALRHGLTMQFRQLGLIVEGLQVRRAAGHIELDDALDLGRIVKLRDDPMRAVRRSYLSTTVGERLLRVEQAPECGGAKGRTGPAQKCAAIQPAKFVVIALHGSVPCDTFVKI